jgi:hypothetical protein
VAHDQCTDMKRNRVRVAASGVWRRKDALGIEGAAGS